ncbi:hypothetical protein ACPWR0_08280 [Pandoraea pneumonica]|uniref:hypothetical protein n=1 Tax=Pandoraea pneumonica TaxID=2508299 RepID=UPI003CF8F0DA
MPTIHSTHHHQNVAELIDLPANTRIGMTKKGGFVSYGGTSFYLHPRQTMRVSRFIQGFRKADTSGREQPTSRLRQLFAHVRAVFLGVKATHFIKRFLGDKTAPRPPVVVPPRANPTTLRDALNAANAANRLNAGTRSAILSRTSQPVSPTMPKMPTMRVMPASTAAQGARASAPPVTALRSHSQPTHPALTRTSDTSSWSSAPQLTPPANAVVRA